MSWVKSDDQMSISRKYKPLTDGAYRLAREAIEWCSRNATDGRIMAVELVDCSARGQQRYADELVSRGIWHRAEDGWCGHEACADPEVDGWVIHDYMEYNPSKAKAAQQRADKAARQARWLAKRRGNGASTDTSHDGSSGASLAVSKGASIDGAPSRPVPSRPEGGGTGTVPKGQPPAATRQDAATGGPKDQNPPTAPPVPSNGRADLAAARDAVRAAQAAARRPGANAGGLDRLRDATPDVPADDLVAEPEKGAA